jgi:hypothetical protein
VDKRVRVTGRIDEREPASRTPGSGSSAGSTEDTKANSLTAAGDSTTRHVKVESVQVIAQDCNVPR